MSAFTNTREAAEAALRYMADELDGDAQYNGHPDMSADALLIMQYMCQKACDKLPARWREIAGAGLLSIRHPWDHETVYTVHRDTTRDMHGKLRCYHWAEEIPLREASDSDLEATREARQHAVAMWTAAARKSAAHIEAVARHAVYGTCIHSDTTDGDA